MWGRCNVKRVIRKVSPSKMCKKGMESEPLLYLGQSSKVQRMSMESILLDLFKAQQRGPSNYSNKTGLGGETRYEFKKTAGGGTD